MKKNKNASITFRTSRNNKQFLETLANINDSSVSNIVNYCIDKHIQEVKHVENTEKIIEKAADSTEI